MRHTVKPSDIYASRSHVQALLDFEKLIIVDFRQPVSGELYIVAPKPKTERCFNSENFAGIPRFIVKPAPTGDWWE